MKQSSKETKGLFEVFLGIFIAVYILFFSWLSIFRYQNLQSHYYDLGIMDQTVYNTSQGRILELTSKDTLENIVRMSIHNDIFLAALAPFYFIHSGPETLLVLQTIVLALGSIPLYLLSKKITKSKFFSIVISICYLLYPALERSNLFDFHVVTFATTFLLFAFYFGYVKKYISSLIFIFLSLSTKENVGLTTMFMGVYFVLNAFYNCKESRAMTWQSIFNIKRLLHCVRNDKDKHKQIIFGLLVFVISLLWFILSIWVIIPAFRQGQSAHFAVERYEELGGSPGDIIRGIITKPDTFISRVFSDKTMTYLSTLFSPIAFLSLLGLPILLIASPEFAINILSNDGNMRNIFFHYTAILTPFIFLSAIFGSYFISKKLKLNIVILAGIIMIASLISASIKSPIPFSQNREHINTIPQAQKKALHEWQEKLKNDSIIVTATGHIAPMFTNRRVFYLFSERYTASDYVLVEQSGLDSYPDPEYNRKVYEILKKDKKFALIYNKAGLEVYKKL